MLSNLSVSAVGCALRCGEQFRRRYMLGEIIPPGVAAGRGRGVHEASRSNLAQKIITGRDMPVSDMKDAARDGFIESFRRGVFLSRDEEAGKAELLNRALNDCINLTGLYAAEVAPRIQPRSTEQRITADIGRDMPLVGVIDYDGNVGDGPLVIGDLKTSGRAWPEDRAEQELQPVVYAHLYEQTKGVRPGFLYHVLVGAHRGERAQEFSVEVTDTAIGALMAILDQALLMIRTGAFMPCDRSNFLCSERWCGYYLTCRYVGNRAGSWV
jgi:hypothetical protein